MTALTAQGLTMKCLFVVFLLSPTLGENGEVIPIVAFVTVKGGAGIKDATSTMTLALLHP